MCQVTGLGARGLPASSKRAWPSHVGANATERASVCAHRPCPSCPVPRPGRPQGHVPLLWSSCERQWGWSAGR